MRVRRGPAVAFALTLAICGAACGSISFYLANAPTAFGSYRRFSDLAYGEGPRRRLDLYAPKAACDRPVVVFWYGGSWTSGRKADYRFVGAALAESGFVVAVPDYRLHPEVGFPGFVDDGALAVAWLQHNAHRYGGDPRWIVLVGHSAGAHTAAYLAMNQDALRRAGAQPSWIRGLVALAGPYALDPDSPFLRRIFKPPYDNDDWQPVRFVDGSDPPALLIHGDEDRTVDVRHTEALRGALASAGVSVETQIYSGAGHIDPLAAFARIAAGRAPVLEDSVRFIRSVTEPPEPTPACAAH